MILLPPSSEVQKKIHERMYRDRRLLSKEIRSLKEWIASEPHLPQDIDDIWLEKFFYGCKYDLPNCKKKLDKYFSARSLMSDAFVNRDPTSPELREFAKVCSHFTLPNFSPEGYRIVYGGILDYDPKKLDFDLILKRVTLTGDYTMHVETCHGFVGIIDLEGATFSHALKVTPTFAKRAIFCLQDAYPFKVQAVHFINAPVFIDVGLKVFKFFMKKKMKKRIFAHSKGSEEIFKMFPVEILPNEYGGKAGSIRELTEKWQEELEKYRDVLVADAERRTDESKRRGKPPYKEWYTARK